MILKSHQKHGHKTTRRMTLMPFDSMEWKYLPCTTVHFLKRKKIVWTMITFFFHLLHCFTSGSLSGFYFASFSKTHLINIRWNNHKHTRRHYLHLNFEMFLFSSKKHNDMAFYFFSFFFRFNVQCTDAPTSERPFKSILIKIHLMWNKCYNFHWVHVN